MEGLIKLLNEYGKEHFEKCTNSENDLRIRKEICTEAYDEEVIISKRFGFIKWLVDNDKIDEDKVPHNIYHSELVNDDYRDDVQQCIMTQGKKEVSSEFAEDEELLMLLAISDTPIDDLISYLK